MNAIEFSALVHGYVKNYSNELNADQTGTGATKLLGEWSWNWVLHTAIRRAIYPA